MIPQEDQNLLEQASQLFIEGKIREADNTLDLLQDRKSLPALRLRLLIYTQVGLWQVVGEIANELMNTDPRTPEQFYGLACDLIPYGKLSMAKENLYRAISFNPEIKTRALADPALEPLWEYVVSLN